MMIGCAGVVSVSASCGRHCNLTQSSFSPSCFLMYYASWSCHVVTSQSYIQRRYIPVSLCFTNSYLPLSFSSLSLSCNLSSSLRSLQVGQNKIIRDQVKLKSFSNNFLNEFSQCIQKNNKVKHFQEIIKHLVQFVDDNRQ